MTSATTPVTARLASGPVLGSAPPSRAARLAAVLEAAPEAELSPRALTVLAGDLGGALQGLVSELPPEEQLVLDAHTLRSARRHPERLAGGEDAFVPSPRTCRRTVGLLAAGRCVRGFAPGPQAAVGDILAAALEADGGDVVAPSSWWVPWFRTLASGGRAVVAAEAVTWATQMLTVLDWRRLARPPALGGRDDWWPCPGPRRVALRGRADARLLVGRRPALFVVGAGSCGDDWRVDLAFPALVSALGRPAPAAPCRVVGAWPQSGQVRVLTVDDALLAYAADAAVAAVGTWVDARLEAAAPARP